MSYMDVQARGLSFGSRSDSSYERIVRLPTQSVITIHLALRIPRNQDRR